MTKDKFFASVRDLYRCGNRSDSDGKEPDEQWVDPRMAQDVCGNLDDMLRAMVEMGTLSPAEHQAFYDTL